MIEFTTLFLLRFLPFTFCTIRNLLLKVSGIFSTVTVYKMEVVNCAAAFFPLAWPFFFFFFFYSPSCLKVAAYILYVTSNSTIHSYFVYFCLFFPKNGLVIPTLLVVTLYYIRILSLLLDSS